MLLLTLLLRDDELKTRLELGKVNWLSSQRACCARGMPDIESE